MPADSAIVWRCDNKGCDSQCLKDRRDPNPQPQNWINVEIFTYPDSMVATFCSLDCAAFRLNALKDDYNQAKAQLEKKEITPI